MKIRTGKKSEKYKIHIKSDDFYEYYSRMHFKEIPQGRKNNIINTKSKYYLTKTKYNKILSEFHKEIRDLILYKSFDFTMPARMGVIGIRKRKIKSYVNKEGEVVNNYPVDWGKTLELWEKTPEAREKNKLIRHLNKHSNGYIAQWYYSKYNATYMNKSVYKFIPCRTAKNLLTKVMLDEDRTIDYYLL